MDKKACCDCCIEKLEYEKNTLLHEQIEVENEMNIYSFGVSTTLVIITLLFASASFIIAIASGMSKETIIVNGQSTVSVVLLFILTLIFVILIIFFMRKTKEYRQLIARKEKIEKDLINLTTQWAIHADVE